VKELDSNEGEWQRSLEDILGKEKVDLTELKSNDVIVAKTENSLYRIVIADPELRSCQVTCERWGRPSGAMRLMGCTIGDSSTISPDALFCDGNLEFRGVNESGQDVVHRTSAIKELGVVQRI
jgi:hypothetical protein